MVKIFSGALVLFVAFFIVAGCASEPVAPEPADPEGFAQAIQSFENAYDELNVAITATPQWQTMPELAIRVRGLAELAEYRAEKIRPFVLQELISDAAIELMKAQARKRAMIDQHKLAQHGGTFLESSESQLATFAAESAYHRIWNRIETLEAFAIAERSTPWIDNTVIVDDREDLLTIVSTTTDSAESWQRVQMSRDGFIEDRLRAQTLLDRLNGKKPVEPIQ